MSKNYTTFLFLVVDQLEFSRLEQLFSKREEQYELKNLSECGLGNLFGDSRPFLSKEPKATSFSLEQIPKYSTPLEYYHHILGNLDTSQKPNLLQMLNDKGTKTISISDHDLSNLGFAASEQIFNYPRKIRAVEQALELARIEGSSPNGTLIFSDISYNSTPEQEVSSLRSLDENLGTLVTKLELGDIIMLAGNPASRIYNGSNRVPLLSLRKGFNCLGGDIKIANNNTPAIIGHIIAQEFRCEEPYLKQPGLESYF